MTSCSKKIIERLQATLGRYNLGWLAEEGSQDNSRLEKYGFWTVDPIDGTLFFAEGKEGFAVSISLVDNDGNSLIGVVYDPATDKLYQTALGKPVMVNERSLQTTKNDSDSPITLVLDRGFVDHPWYPTLSKEFRVEFVGGGHVMNVMYLLQNPRSFYMKVPKKRLGGCAIWDLAAASILCQNSGGSAQSLMAQDYISIEQKNLFQRRWLCVLRCSLFVQRDQTTFLNTWTRSKYKSDDTQSPISIESRNLITSLGVCTVWSGFTSVNDS